ncbi:MAG: hypothetical protein PBV01_11455 [Brucella anthropi]
MKIFGKMIETPERVKIPPVQIGVDEDGEPIFGPEQEYPVRIFRNKDGVDWFDLAKTYPHPFYIAVDDSGRIVSMTDDFQQLQIADYAIIGIDDDYGFTFGPGGSVYGMLWTGIEIINPVDVMTPEEKRAVMPDLERWRVNTVIDLEPGLREKINAAIEALPEPQRTISRNKLADVQTFKRIDPLFDMLGSTPDIGKTPEDIDAMWETALKLA